MTVNNVAPPSPPVPAATTSPGVATSFVLGSFSDPGVGDQPWAVTVNWGDGLTDTFAITTQGTLGSRAHTYTAAGTRTVTVRVTDKDGGWSEATFTVTVTAPVQPALTSRALLANNDVEIVGAKIRIVGNVHSNGDIWMLGAYNDVCGSLTAHRWIWRMSTQSCGTTRAFSPAVPMPNMAHYVPGAGAVTQTLTGNRNLNGYTCTNAGGCVVRVTGKLEIRGTITGNVWFVADGGVVIKGDLRPAADGTSRLRIYSKKSIDARRFERDDQRHLPRREGDQADRQRTAAHRSVLGQDMGRAERQQEQSDGSDDLERGAPAHRRGPISDLRPERDHVLSSGGWPPQ